MGRGLKKNLETVLGACVIAVFVCVSVVMVVQMLRFDAERGNPLKGSGTRDDPFIIAGEEDYFYFAKELEDPSSVMLTADVALTADLAFDTEHGGVLLGNDDLVFAGCFDGRGHSISGLSGKGDCVGLFPQLKGCVLNLNVTGSRFEGRRAGGITGKLWANGFVENCFCEIEAEGEYIGGVCGECRGSMENCVSGTKLPAAGLLEDAIYADRLFDDTECPGAGLLNDNVRLLPPREGHPFCEWAERDGRAAVSTGVLPRIMGISVPVFMGKKNMRLKAFFSRPGRRFMLVIPSRAAADSYNAEVTVSDGRSFDTVIASGDTSIDFYGEEIPLDIEYFDDVPALMVDFYSESSLSALHRDKEHEETGEMLCAFADGSTTELISDVELSGRGNDSYSALKKGYGLKLKEEKSLCGMESSAEYNLIAGYRDNSMFNYIFTRDMFRALDFPFAHEYRLVNLYINGEPQGLYFLTEKMAIGRSAFDLTDLKTKTEQLNKKRLYDYPRKEEWNEKGKLTQLYYEIPEEPEDVTGGYLMEVTMEDFGEGDSRFMTDYGVILSSKGDKYLGRRQMEYIRGLFQDFENAVYSQDGYNDKGKYYLDYIDVDSFADQWILYETMADMALDNSVYYYKDSDITGKDDKIHASFYWDAEHMLTNSEKLDSHFLMRMKETGAKCDYNYAGSGNFWVWIYLHDDFRQAVRERWKEKFEGVYSRALSEELLDSSQGMGSIAWYRTQYTESLRINDRMWPDTDYRAKCDWVAERLGRRMKVLEDYFK